MFKLKRSKGIISLSLALTCIACSTNVFAGKFKKSRRHSLPSFSYTHYNSQMVPDLSRVNSKHLKNSLQELTNLYSPESNTYFFQYASHSLNLKSRNKRRDKVIDDLRTIYLHKIDSLVPFITVSENDPKFIKVAFNSLPSISVNLITEIYY